MKSILPKEYIQGVKRHGGSLIGPNTKVILLTPCVSNVQETLQFPQGQERIDDNIPEKLLAEADCVILNESKRCVNRTLGKELSLINLDRLKSFIASYIANPEILHIPKFAFYKDYLESLGVKVPNRSEKGLYNHRVPYIKDVEESQSGEYNCAECDRVFISNYHLECHMKIHTDKKPYQCSWCGSAYTAIGSLKTHMQVHVGQRPYKCSQCDRTFATKTLLLNHMRTMHIGEKPYKCMQCNKSFSVQSNLRNHIARHFGTKRYQCNQCGKAFSYKQHLISHVLIHTGERPYKCSQCGNSFSQHSSLKQHMRTHALERPYKCNQCDKTFNYKIVFINHMRMEHTGEKPFKCSYCDKTFSVNSRLMAHMALHTDVKHNLCTQFFAKNVSLKENNVIQTGERSYKCSQCGETFTTKKNLTKHIRYNHIGPTQFLCTKCERVFVCKVNLIEHMRIHTGETPYECNQCGNAFARYDKLEEHMRIHIEEEPYISNQCENNFGCESSLYKNIGTHRDCTEFRNDIIVFPETSTDVKQEIDDNFIKYNSTQSEMYYPQRANEGPESVLKIKEEIVVNEEILDGQNGSKNFLYLMQPSC